MRIRTLFPIAALLLGCLNASTIRAQPDVDLLQLNDKLEQQAEKAVVYISVQYQRHNSNYRYIESGSGFFVADRCVITDQHVIANALTYPDSVVNVRVLSGTPQSKVYEAQILKADSRRDLALLRIPKMPAGITPMQLHPQLPGKQSEVFAFGFPLGTMLDHSTNGPNVCLRRGYVSRLINDGTDIEADLNIDKGISGGPLTDSQGIVRGVVRSMAGSDYNKSYAGIAIASPVIIAFCKESGCQVTLKGGQVIEPGSPLPSPIVTQEAPRPRVQMGVDNLRAFFSVGSELRLNTLVPAILADTGQGYTSDILQSARSNMGLLIANLQKAGAPADLLGRAKDIGKLLSQASVRPETLTARAKALEGACDSWTESIQQTAAEEKLNYDFGAWLTELSVDAIAPATDLKTCAYFVQQAERQSATDEVLQLLQQIREGLQAIGKNEHAPERRAVRKEADRLIGVGYLATTDSGLSPAPKVDHTAPVQQHGGNNQIHLDIP